IRVEPQLAQLGHATLPAATAILSHPGATSKSPATIHAHIAERARTGSRRPRAWPGVPPYRPATYGLPSSGGPAPFGRHDAERGRGESDESVVAVAERALDECEVAVAADDVAPAHQPAWIRGSYERRVQVVCLDGLAWFERDEQRGANGVVEHRGEESFE